MKVTKFKLWDEEYDIVFVKASYRNNGNLAIEAVHNTGDGWDIWCDVTVNIIPLDDGMAVLDTNNCSSEILSWLYKHKYCKNVSTISSGYCIYNVVKFSDKFLNEICIAYDDFLKEGNK